MLLTERYKGRICGVLSCPDRVVMMGTLVEFGHARVATRYLKQRGIRIFDFSEFAKALRDAIRTNPKHVAEAAGIEIEFLRSANVNKEEHVRNILAQRGTQPGLVCILNSDGNGK